MNPLRSAYTVGLKGLNAVYDTYTGGKRRPVFFDPAAVCPPLLELDRNFAVIRQELQSVLPGKERIPRYHELDAEQYPISGEVDRDRDWKVFLLYAMGEKPRANREQCPLTAALLDQVPDL